MISQKEILRDVKLEDMPQEHQDNYAILFEKINKIREAYGKPMTVNSGYRSKDDQIRIYKAKGVPVAKIPWGSQHLKCAAIDISDRDGKLWEWTIENMALIEELDLYLECKTATPTWIHYQLYPPRSKSRIFKP